MTSLASDANQQWLRQSYTPPVFHADTPPLGDGEALSGLGASQDTAIVIPDDSDTEDEGYCEAENPNSPQSHTTIATSIASHFGEFLRFVNLPRASPDSQRADSMSTKHDQTESDATIGMDTLPGESPVGVEGDSIRMHGSHLGHLADPEPDLQSLCQTNPTSVGDPDFGTSSTNTESQSCLTVSDEQLATEAIPIAPATPAASEPVAMVDAVSDEESCDGSQRALVSSPRRTCSPTAVTPEVMTQTPLHDGDVDISAGGDGVAPVVHNSTPSPTPSPKSRPDQDQGSCSSSDTESGSSVADSRSSLGARACPPSREGLFQRHSRRKSLRAREMVQDKDSDTDTEGSGSDDGSDDSLDVPERGHNEDYCPSSPEVQGYDSGDDPEDEGLNRRKRQKVSLSPYTSTRVALNSPQLRSTRSAARLPRRRRISHSLAGSQTSAVPSDVGTCAARFEEWPLSNVSLKRVTE
jgi:hypothetical protein